MTSHIGAMWRLFASALMVVLLAGASGAADRPQGLLWNHSGLPATLPLQIKTKSGADYLLHLRDVETGQEVLAAYIRGGEFFRVLVPVGTYDLLFATGPEWHGEAALFGPQTRSFALETPLRFAATVSRKMGHLVDLRAPTQTVVRDFGLCQRLALDPDSLTAPTPVPRGPGLPPETVPRAPQPDPAPRYDLISRICD